MLVRTVAIRARVKAAHRLVVRERTALPRTVGAIPARRRGRVLVAAHRVRAIREEAADFFRVMGFQLCRRGVAAGAFGVFAGDAEAARVGHVDGDVVRRGGGDVRVGAVLVDTAFIELAHSSAGIEGLRLG